MSLCRNGAILDGEPLCDCTQACLLDSAPVSRPPTPSPSGAKIVRELRAMADGSPTMTEYSSAGEPELIRRAADFIEQSGHTKGVSKP